MPEPYCDESIITGKLDELMAVNEQIRAELARMNARSAGSVPKAATLVNEYYGNEDLNDDGYIYGPDFHIPLSCPDMPPMLQAIHPVDADGNDMALAEWPGSVPVPWAEFLAGNVDLYVAGAA